MFISGLILFVGLWLLLTDIAPVRRAKLMGNPWLIHCIVIGSGLAIHGGSAEGAMAAIVSGICSALYVRFQQRWNGYIRGGIWHPGIARFRDPRSSTRALSQDVICTPKPRRASSPRWNRAPPRGSSPGLAALRSPSGRREYRAQRRASSRLQRTRTETDCNGLDRCSLRTTRQRLQLRTTNSRCRPETVIACRRPNCPKAVTRRASCSHPRGRNMVRLRDSSTS